MQRYYCTAAYCLPDQAGLEGRKLGCQPGLFNIMGADWKVTKVDRDC